MVLTPGDFDYRADAEKFVLYWVRASRVEPLRPDEVESLSIAQEWLSLFDTATPPPAAIGALVSRATAAGGHGGSVAYELALHIQLWLRDR